VEHKQNIKQVCYLPLRKTGVKFHARGRHLV
jgi:hypothetical protein